MRRGSMPHRRVKSTPSSSRGSTANLAANTLVARAASSQRRTLSGQCQEPPLVRRLVMLELLAIHSASFRSDRGGDQFRLRGAISLKETHDPPPIGIQLGRLETGLRWAKIRAKVLPT